MSGLNDFFDEQALKTVTNILEPDRYSYIIHDSLTGARIQKGSIMVDVVAPLTPTVATSDAEPVRSRKGRHAHLKAILTEHLKYGETLPIEIPEGVLAGGRSEVHKFRAAIRGYGESLFPSDCILLHPYVTGAHVFVSRSKAVS